MSQLKAERLSGEETPGEAAEGAGVSSPDAGLLEAQATRRRLKAEGMLLLLTVVWGSTFPVVKYALTFASPILFVAVRFLVAVLLTLAIFSRHLRKIPRQTWLEGTGLGILMGLAFVTQTVGLGSTTASRSGFLTTLYVAFTPPLEVALGRRVPAWGLLLGGALVVAGLYFMAVPDGSPLTGLLKALFSGLNVGDWWTLACAVLFTVYIVAIDPVAPRHEPLQLTFVQLLSCGLTAGGLAFFLEPVRLDPTWTLGGILVYLALSASLLGVWVQARYQHESTPTRASIIYGCEAVFAALLAAVWLGERMGLNASIGAGLILAGLVASVLTRGK